MAYLLHQLLRDASTRFADRPAIIDGDRTVSYGELEARSTRTAELLRSAGVRRGDRVGLYLDKSADAITALYAVLKAGAAYVPLDPHAPVARLGYVAGDCGVRAIVADTAKLEGCAEIARKDEELVAVVDLTRDDSAERDVIPGV